MSRSLDELDGEAEPIPDCADPRCPAPRGGLCRLDTGCKRPMRHDGGRFGIKGEICETCYQRRYRAEYRQREGNWEHELKLKREREKAS